MNNDLTMPRHVCPKCGKPYKWIMTKEPIYQLVVFHFKCLDCGTTDSISISERQFYETIWDMEKGGAPTISDRYDEGFRDGYAQCINDKEERKENNRLFQKGGAE